MEKVLPTTAYEASLDFYERKITGLQEKLEEVSEDNLWERVDTIEELEHSQLKLDQIQRRREVGLI